MVEATEEIVFWWVVINGKLVALKYKGFLIIFSLLAVNKTRNGLVKKISSSKPRVVLYLDAQGGIFFAYTVCNIFRFLKQICGGLMKAFLQAGSGVASEERILSYFSEITSNNMENLDLLLARQTKQYSPTVNMALFKKHVEVVNLELSSYCNRKCQYCPVAISTRNSEQIIMETSLLTKIVEELALIRFNNLISLNMYNEPLENPNLLEQIAFIREYCPRSYIFFNTNGDRLNKTLLIKLINSGTNAITVTLHPPYGRAQTPDKILRRLKKMLEKLGLKIPSHIKSTTFVKDITQFETLIYGLKLKIQWIDFNQFGTYRGGTVQNNAKKNFSRVSPCAKPFSEFTIYYDGSVVPCCEVFHDKHTSNLIVSNINNKSIFEVYGSPQMRKFRRSTFSFGTKSGVCEKCTVNDFSRQIEKELRDQIIKQIDSDRF